jgi:hypothetical protein
MAKLEEIQLVKTKDPLVNNETYVLNLRGRKWRDYKPEDQEKVDTSNKIWKTFKAFIMEYFG